MRLAVPILVLMLAAPASADTFSGQASVIDGDTIDIHGERIRILDIDAPESRQTCTPDVGELAVYRFWRCGQQVTIALANLVFTNTVTCDTRGKDRYKRWLALCQVNGTDLGEWMARHGWAVPYRDCKCKVIRKAADRAKASKIGIGQASLRCHGSGGTRIEDS